MKLQSNKFRVASKFGAVSIEYTWQLWLVVSMKRMEENESKFPEFALEKDFQCHNTQLVKEVVCRTIQKFVKNPQDVRLAITVSFQPHTADSNNTHEQEAVATVEVDKPGNFYPGGQEQRIRNKELEVLRQVEKAKQQERREMRKLAREEEERKRRKTETGVKRPSGGAVHERARMTRVAPPLPFKAETRRLPTGEIYAVREWVYSYTEKEPLLPFPVTSDAIGEPMIVRETKLQAYEHWHLTPDSEPDAHAVELQNTAEEETEALEKGDTEPKGKPRSVVPSTAEVTKAVGEDMEEQKPFTSLPKLPQKTMEKKRRKKERKKRPILNAQKISVVEPKVFGELVKSQPEDPIKHFVTPEPVIILSQKGQSELHAPPISKQIPPTVFNAPPREVELVSDIPNADEETTSSQSAISSPASTDAAEEGSLHEFKTPPESSSAANSPVLPAKTVKNVEFAKSSSEVPVSAPSAALPESGERETPQKAGPVQDVTPATTSAQKPPGEVKVTPTEQASTKTHLVIPSHIQEVAEEQKNKIEPYLSTVIQSVTPSSLLPKPTVGSKNTESPTQPLETPAAPPSAAFPVTGKEGKQKKTLEAAIPSTVGTIEQEQSKITKLPQLQAIPAAIPSTSRIEVEDEPHKVAFDDLKEARNVVTASTRQIVKKEKVTKLPMRTVSPTIPLPSRAEEEKPKETKVPVSPAVPPLKEPTKFSAIKSAALTGSAEEEVKPKKVELLSTPFVLDNRAKDVEPHLVKTHKIPSKELEDELFLTKAESTPPIGSMPRVAEELKLTKPDSEQGADSIFRYTIRSEGSQESEEEEKPKILPKTPSQPDMPAKAVEHIKTTKLESKQKFIQPSPESSLSGSAGEQEVKKDVLQSPGTTHRVGPPSTLPPDVADGPSKKEEKGSMPQVPTFKPLPSTLLPSTAEVSQITKPELHSFAKVHAIPPSAALPESVKEETSKNIKHETPLALPKYAEEDKTAKAEVKPSLAAVSPTRVPLKAVEVLNQIAPAMFTISEVTKAKTLKSEQSLEVPASISPSVPRKSEPEDKGKKIEPSVSTKSQSPHRPTILPFKIGADVKVTKLKAKQPSKSSLPTAASTENIDWTKPEGFNLDVRKSQPVIQPIPSPKALEEVKIASLELQEPIHVEDSVVLALSSTRETEKTRSPLPVARLTQKEETKPEEVLQKSPSKVKTAQGSPLPIARLTQREETKPVEVLQKSPSTVKTAQSPIISIVTKKKELGLNTTTAISPTSLPSPLKEKKMKFELPPTLSPKVIKDKKHLKGKVVHSPAEPQTLTPVVMPTKIEEKSSKSEPRRPSVVEEMNAVRELGSPQDDATDRDGLSLETIDVHSVVDLRQHGTFYVAMPDESRIETKGSTNIQGSIKLADDGKSPKVLAYINVG